MILSSKPVLVTGASGFVAIHSIIQLLEQGYAVRGTLRTMTREQELRETLRKYIDANDKLEFVEADLNQDSGWKQAVDGCEYVFHIASPFPLLEPEHEDELIKPAVEGTLRVLRAAHAAGVRRVVLVSSNAAISAGHNGENRTFTEDDWSDLNKPIGAYSKSKTLAERAAWEFIHGAENARRMELVTINPPYIFGPIPNKDFPTSAEIMRIFMRGEVPGVAKLKIGIVDVRDVASALILAMTTPDAADERIATPAATLWNKEIVDILHKEYSGRGYKKIPTMVLPVFLVRFLALFDKRIALVVPALNWDFELSNEKAKRTLKWSPRSKEDAILSMAESMVEQGFV